MRVLPYACITKGQQGRELVDFEALAPYVAGFTDDGRGVQSESMMRSRHGTGAKAVEGLIAAHCEQDDLLNGGCIHDGEYARRNGYKGISSESEWRQLERDLRLAEGNRLQIPHVPRIRQRKRRADPKSQGRRAWT